jgi:hypothetical protein
MSDQAHEREWLFFNGVNGTTGQYDLEPMTVEAFAASLLDQPLPADPNAAGFYENFVETPDYGLADDRDPKQIAQAGWGVILAQGEDPAVLEALQPLLDLRREQAGEFYYQYAGAKGKRRGYAAGESKKAFLEGRGAEPFGPADPNYAPYYLLIVGDPAKIPFQFQYQLDIQYAVGRIHFRTPDEYAQYAQTVVRVESGREPLRLPRRATFFGVDHGARDATHLSAHHLIRPLAAQLQELSAETGLGWEFSSLLGEDATKAHLASLLDGAQAAPTLLFTASHGIGFNSGDPRQSDHQGALLCQDWKGPKAGQRLEDCYYSADDVPSSADLSGRMAFHFACYGAGTPRYNNYVVAHDRQAAPQIAPRDFVARLPHKLMLNGALAVVGHIERAWGVSIAYSKRSVKDDRHLATYRSMLRRLMDGHPVGSAIEYVNEKYGEYSAALSRGVEARDLELDDAPDDYEMVRLWRANNDARNFVVLGDPAARLPLAAVGEQPTAPRSVSRAARAEIALEHGADPPFGESEAPADDKEVGSQMNANASSPESDVSFLPAIEVPEELQERDPKLYAAWRAHITAGFEQNDVMFKRVLNAFMGAYQSTVLMYKTLFGVGIASFILAAALSAWMRQPAYGLIFGGLSAASFLSYFLSKPLQSLEQNLQFITWLGVIYNNYWTRLLYMMDQRTVQADLQAAADDSIQQLGRLIDRYEEANSRRPTLDRN